MEQECADRCSDSNPYLSAWTRCLPCPRSLLTKLPPPRTRSTASTKKRFRRSPAPQPKSFEWSETVTSSPWRLSQLVAPDPLATIPTAKLVISSQCFKRRADFISRRGLVQWAGSTVREGLYTSSCVFLCVSVLASLCLWVFVPFSPLALPLHSPEQAPSMHS